MELALSNSTNKKLLIPVKKAITDFTLIEDGDRVAVGLSGGKDSSTLLYILTMLQRRLPISFEIVPISLSLGFPDTDLDPMKEFTDALGQPLHVLDTANGKILFDVRKEKNPCSLCANMRRGILNDAAKKLGCNKVALGHHLDDALETFFMNFFFNGRLGTFQPETYQDQSGITVIRPMVYLEEQAIIRFIEAKQIPIVHNPCPADKQTRREEVKNLVKQLSLQYPDIRKKFLHAIKHADFSGFWTMEED